MEILSNVQRAENGFEKANFLSKYLYWWVNLIFLAILLVFLKIHIEQRRNSTRKLQTRVKKAQKDVSNGEINWSIKLTL